MTEQERVERVAKAINGPHDATHIGAEKLRELQQHRWDNQTTKLDKGVAISAARASISAMDRLVVDGQRCEAVNPKKLPNRIMAWHSSTTLNHIGTWATTRYPDSAVAYVLESAGAQTSVLCETSPRAVIGEIGCQIHNLACELQNNEGLAEKLESFACELWRVAQTLSTTQETPHE